MFAKKRVLVSLVGMLASVLFAVWSALNCCCLVFFSGFGMYSMIVEQPRIHAESIYYEMVFIIMAIVFGYLTRFGIKKFCYFRFY